MTANAQPPAVDWIPDHLPEETKKRILEMTEETPTGQPSIECTENLIRHWCETVEDGNRMYLDEEYAKSHGYNGIVAPPAIVMSLAIPYRWPRPETDDEAKGGNAHYKLKKLMNTPVGVVVENETDYFRFIEVGDRLYSSSRLVSISPLKKTRIGEGYFWDLETLDRNQRGQLVTKSKMTMFAYNPGRTAADDDDGPASVLSQATEAALKSDQSSHVPADQATYWDDVSVGDELPQLFMPITVTRCIYLASATRDFSPHHTNRDYAQQEVKARDMFLNTPFNTGMLSRFVTDWGGPESRLRKLRLAMKENICAGDDLIINGTVTRKYLLDDERCAEIDIRVSTQHGPAYQAGAVLALAARRARIGPGLTVASRLSDRCAIAGVGNTAYTRGTDKATVQLHLEASLRAIADAGLRPADIDAIMPNDTAGVCVEDLMVNLGLPDLAFSATVRSGGASFVASIQDACFAIEAGVVNHVLVVAGRRGFTQKISKGEMSSGARAQLPGALAAVGEFERPYGMLSPGQMYAQAAQRHMHLFGTTSEQFGWVAVAQRKHANLNPQALMYSKTLTIEQHQASRIVTSPFHLYDCSLESDGAAAVVVTSAERARDLAKLGILISGVGEGHGNPPTSITQKTDMSVIEGVKSAGQRAFAMAGLAPADIDCAQLHDPFSWLVVATLEALGFCERGEGGPFVENGRIELGGELPVNTHGGLLSEAHQSGANHVVEAVRQLRGEVEPQRQVPDCRTVLVNNEGDMHEGSVVILRSDV